MKKYFKLFSLLLIAGLGFFLGTKVTNAVTNHEFFYDYEFNIKMPTELKDGENDLILSPVETNPNNANVELENLIISYKVTEISKEVYEEFKVLQDKIDAKAGTIENDDDEDIIAFNALINEKYVDNDYWCYNDPTVGKITISTDFCGEKYYIITVDAEEPNVVTNDFPWNYKVARVYKVIGTKTDCTAPPQDTPTEDTTDEESPKTGVATPYIILGSVAVISIASIAVSKKKKFI